MRRAALGLLIAVFGGCGGGTTVAPADAGRTDTGRRTDRGVATDAVRPVGDQDGDGLCDATEAMTGTDPTLGDTDGDGLTDLFELRAGSDPLSSRVPDAVDRVQLREAPGEVVVTEHAVVVDGQGGVIAGLWQDRGAGVDERLASAWVAFELVAVGADPAGVVQSFSGSRFVGVLGRTQLTWRLTSRSRGGVSDGADGGVMRLGCRRAYELVLVVLADGGETVRSRQLVIDVLPAQGGSGVWPAVDADGFCQATSCQ
ncbi:MAG: hypothetical protein JWM10_409 [Myxococcaceae bacterium]|nr:hypothetical protein [Myxococcaceae bacterium]